MYLMTGEDTRIRLWFAFDSSHGISAWFQRGDGEYVPNFASSSPSHLLERSHPSERRQSKPKMDNALAVLVLLEWGTFDHVIEATHFLHVPGFTAAFSRSLVFSSST